MQIDDRLGHLLASLTAKKCCNVNYPKTLIGFQSSLQLSAAVAPVFGKLAWAVRWLNLATSGQWRWPKARLRNLQRCCANKTCWGRLIYERARSQHCLLKDCHLHFAPPHVLCSVYAPQRFLNTANQREMNVN